MKSMLSTMSGHGAGNGRARRWAAWLAAALLACCCAPAWSAPRSLAFRQIDSLGPDTQSVISIAQDKQGFIWVGTIEGGLLRYDGSQARKYINDPADARSVPAGRIADLYNDSEGQLWIAGDGGLARFDPSSNSFTRYAAPGAKGRDLIVRYIVSDGAGGMWLATWGGLQHFDPRSGSFLSFRADGKPGSLARNDVNALAVDDHGGLWASTWPSGIDYLAPGATAFAHYRIDSDQQPNPRLNDVRSLHIDSSHVLWIGTDYGLLSWKTGTPWSGRRLTALPPTRISHIEQDRGGDLWISTRTAGLWRYDQDSAQFQVFQHRAEDPLSLSSNAIDVTLHDRTGTLWVGSFTDGLSRANLGSHGFERIIPRDIAPETFKSSNFVRSLTGAPDGKLWLGVDDGLVLFDPAARRVLRHYQADPKRPGALSQNTLYALYQAPGGPLWLGTSKGLARLDHADAPFKLVHFAGKNNDFINAITPGAGGVLWLGTGSGLLRYNPADGAVEQFHRDALDPASLGADSVTALLEDGAGRLWSGDYFRGGGLDLRLPGGTGFQHLRHDAQRADSLSNDFVTSLHEDLDGALWVGTKRGLNRVIVGKDGRPQVRRYGGQGGIGTLLIKAIRSDRAGMIWITTQSGMSKLDPAAGKVTDYAAEDGLSDSYYLNSSAASGDGKLYFGGTGGLTAVNPAIHSSASRPPQGAIIDISLYGRSLGDGALPDGVVLEGSIAAPRRLTLPWDTAVLSLEFASLHYAEPRRNGYRYMLEGFDRDWLGTDARRPLATYTNLAPGNYRFRLQALNNKGLASRDEAVLPINITPPLSATWWFRASAAALLLAAMALLYRWRVRRLTARAAQLTQLVAERTRQLEHSNRQLLEMADTDHATGVASRRNFEQALEREWRRGARQRQPLALARLKLDHFSAYSEQYGARHAQVCLRRVAQLMTGNMHRAGDLVAHYGDGQFAFLAPATAAHDALRIARIMGEALAALALPHAASPLGLVTASIGVTALLPAGETGAAILSDAAERALHQADADGGNRTLAAPDQLAPG